MAAQLTVEQSGAYGNSLLAHLLQRLEVQACCVVDPRGTSFTQQIYSRFCIAASILSALQLALCCSSSLQQSFPSRQSPELPITTH